MSVANRAHSADFFGGALRRPLQAPAAGKWLWRALAPLCLSQRLADLEQGVGWRPGRTRQGQKLKRPMDLRPRGGGRQEGVTSRLYWGCARKMSAWAVGFCLAYGVPSPV